MPYRQFEWTPARIRYLEKNHKDHSEAEMAHYLTAKYGDECSIRQVQYQLKKHGWVSTGAEKPVIVPSNAFNDVICRKWR